VGDGRSPTTSAPHNFACFPSLVEQLAAALAQEAVLSRKANWRTESPMTQSRLESWEAIEAAARLHARLFEWMLQHHDRLAGLFAGRPVDWQGLAGTLATEGLRAC
jgi:predicted metal-dependent hydrolase